MKIITITIYDNDNDHYDNDNYYYFFAKYEKRHFTTLLEDLQLNNCTM